MLKLENGKLPSVSLIYSIAQAFDLSTSEIREICNKYEKPDDGVRIGTYDQVIRDSKWFAEPLSVDDLGVALCANDDSMYRLTKEYAGESSQWVEIFTNYPLSTAFIYRIENGRIEIIGDVTIIIYESGSAPIEDGTLIDSKVTYDSIPLQTMPGAYDAIILNMALLPRFNLPEYHSRLFETAENLISRYHRNGIVLEKLYANVFKGLEAQYRYLGFTPYCDSKPSEANAPVLYKKDVIYTSEGEFKFRENS